VATVLIVESDPLQGFLRKSILERQFLDVLRVSDASEALCLVEQPQFAHKLGLVIASHPMMGIGGPAFVAELHARLPHVPILVLMDQKAPSLGDLAPGPNADPLTAASVRLLPRPFSIDQLLDLAAQMLPQPRLKTA
jgi:CheY-like chemotaxis protein